ncbi:LPXTG cell wall anchor domain-containing protein [Weissella diestrammenae]|uniref:LPXTG cell wall anchor domain-containing protein n=2 Tax=Weissella diestrammenae TaxID=1162633 RepID=A0A7G9T6Q4_9LACO|nr:LPXTG cell wall anchor domain-containing protein [Weissella diestrammenae]QNN75779.1 LPXTG cell wall anchor domain-containing protein [Weissella diestrammenae]
MNQAYSLTLGHTQGGKINGTADDADIVIANYSHRSAKVLLGMLPKTGMIGLYGLGLFGMLLAGYLLIKNRRQQ